MPASSHDSEKAVNFLKDSDALSNSTTIALSQEEIFEKAREEGLKPALLAKILLCNDAMAEIGMGKYQWQLFMTAGFGWFADNLWLQAVSILMPYIAYESGWVGQPYVKYLTFSIYIGMTLGAIILGMSSDVIGRKWAFNVTLFLSATFGIICGFASSFEMLAGFVFVVGFGVGGNLPVDSALFLEFLPSSHQALLTFLSVFWSFGQAVASLICWGLLSRSACNPAIDPICNDQNNAGWRHSFYTMGGLMLFLATARMLLPMHESPKFLVSIGNDAKAVEVINHIAKTNGKPTSLTVEKLQEAAAPFLNATDNSKTESESTLSKWQLAKQSLTEMDGEHLKALFVTRRLAWSTSLIIFCFAALGIGYPLYFAFLGSYLQAKNTSIEEMSINAVYSTYTYQAACGIPGSILATFLVQSKRGGRKFAMSVCTLISGVLLFCLTQARSKVAVNLLTCGISLFSNAFYGVLYGYAPEVFPTTSRGTGDALANAAARFCGLFAPIVAMYATTNVEGPVYGSAGIFVLVGLVMLLFPIETAGTTAL